MATSLITTYNARKDENTPNLNLSRIGEWITPNGLSDGLPYSNNDDYGVDEPGIVGLEKKYLKLRYQLGQLGGGSQNAPGYSPEYQ